jgi:DNA-binding transcriptional ArsR family regulator
MKKASTKKKYSVEEVEVAHMMKLLAHPARVAIINALLEAPTCCCGDFQLNLPLAQSTISRHLSVLKTAGLIQGETEGTSICYCINPIEWEKIKKWLSLFLNQSNKNRIVCC